MGQLQPPQGRPIASKGTTMSIAVEHSTLSRSSKAGNPQQLDLFIPQPVRSQGLADMHPRPLVGVRRDDGSMRSWRTSPRKAWKKPYLQINPGNGVAAVILDCDWEAAQALAFDFALLAEAIPEPSIQIIHKTNGHRHLHYYLAPPVHLNANSKPKPIRALAVVANWLATAVQADNGYAGCLTRNPLDGVDESCRVVHGQHGPWSLRDLMAFIPRDWKPEPDADLSALGRECAMFASAMQWAGRWVNRDNPVLPVCAAINAKYPNPLTFGEVKSCAKKIEAYRNEWRRQGWHKAGFKDWGRQDSEIQAARGRKSAEVRRRAVGNRVVSAKLLRAEGWNVRAIAAELGVGIATAHRWTRDAKAEIGLFHEPT